MIPRPGGRMHHNRPIPVVQRRFFRSKVRTGGFSNLETQDWPIGAFPVRSRVAKIADTHLEAAADQFTPYLGTGANGGVYQPAARRSITQAPRAAMTVDTNR